MSSAVNKAMALAVVGRIVRYVLESGAVRPLIVVNDFGSGITVSGVVFLDIANDAPGEAHDGSGVKLPLMSVSSVRYSSEMEPFTWHWPTRTQQVEGEAALRAEHVQQMFAGFRDNINAKLEAHLEAVGKIADGISEEFHSAVAVLEGKKPNPGAVVEVSTSVHSLADMAGVSAADLDAVAAEQNAANATANAAHDAVVAMQQSGAEVTAPTVEPGEEVGSGG